MKMLSTQIIRKSNSWKEFNAHLQGLTNKEKGDCFEALTKFYLEISPKYKTKLQNVWDLRGLPSDIRNHLNLPPNDEGIDLIAKTKEGGFWAIQCKYRSDELKSLTRDDIDTFIALTFKTCKNFELALVCTTLDRYSHKLKRHYGTDLSLCCGDVWRSLDQQFFQRLHSYLDDKIVLPDPHQPRPHQQAAITRAYEHFVLNGKSRGKLIMPCASGKSLASYWMAKSLKAKKILLAVPSLALIRQTLEVWTNESLAQGEAVHWICVCSDTSVKDVGKDDPIVFSQDLGVLVHTDPDKIAEWLSARSDTTTLVITTYQSGKAIAEASRKADFSFDLGIMDEAHKTVGNKNSLFSHLLFEENIPIKNRLFMTATERRYKGNSEQILSMEDPDIYGDTFYLLSFKEALECQPPILSDYRIVTILVTRSEVADLIKNNVYVKFKETDNEKPEEAETLATALALRKAMIDHPIRHSVSFHSSVKRARIFKDIHDSLNTVFPELGSLKTFHVSGKMPTATRSRELDTFASADTALITNARCLTEGIDIPGIDCVVFADPKKSAIDIVQATGRALRPSPAKELGYIIIPLLIEDGPALTKIPDDSSFEYLLSVLKALAANDQRIIEYFRSRSQGRLQKSGNNTFAIDIPVGLDIDPDYFADSVGIKLWSRLAKLSWGTFTEIREFARSLRLQSQNEWRMYCKGEFPDKPQKPQDIPLGPDKVYKSAGWTTWGDWLGTRRIAYQNMEYLPFAEAREFARSLRIKSKDEWARYCKAEFSDKPLKPVHIPADPSNTYGENGWITWGDWLGTWTISPRDMEYRPFTEAREFARSLQLQGQKEWRRYCKGEIQDKPIKPEDIPANPPQTYGESGWTTWGDWLGNGRIFNKYREYLSFEEAREFARSLGLVSQNEWRMYYKGEFSDKPQRPDDIPSNPDKIYKDSGWTTWPDWFGTQRIATRKRAFRPFKEAREFAISLNFKDYDEWKKYCKGQFLDRPQIPVDIPTDPYSVYKNKGWTSWPNWLGTEATASFRGEHLPFEEARKFVQSLGLQSQNEWRMYCKEEFPDKTPKPKNIPNNPNQTLKDKGWISWPDWLGTSRIANQKREFLSFAEAREFAISLRLKSKDEWARYCKGEFPNKPPKPVDVPAAPARTYQNKGWLSWPDWLGTKRVANQNRKFLPYSQARELVHELQLQSKTDWSKYCKGELTDRPTKPDNIPTAPARTYQNKGWLSWPDWLGTKC